MSKLSAALNRRHDDLNDLVIEAGNANYPSAVVVAIRAAQSEVVDAMRAVIKADGDST